MKTKNQASQQNKNRKKDVIVCKCNSVPRSVLENAIQNGCDTMNKIFDKTSAGVGPCGGSCRRKIVPLLEHYLKTGTFPETLIEDKTGKSIPEPALINKTNLADDTE